MLKVPAVHLQRSLFFSSNLPVNPFPDWLIKSWGDEHQQRRALDRILLFRRLRRVTRTLPEAFKMALHKHRFYFMDNCLGWAFSLQCLETARTHIKNLTAPYTDRLTAIPWAGYVQPYGETVEDWNLMAHSDYWLTPKDTQ